MTHISLETARELHDLGWRRETVYGWVNWSSDLSGEWNVYNTESEDMYHGFPPGTIPAPLVEELLQVLPGHFEELGPCKEMAWFYIHKGPDRDGEWCEVGYDNIEDCLAGYYIQRKDLNIGEALGQLVVKLVKKGLLTLE